jgi:hypothetical protein
MPQANGVQAMFYPYQALFKHKLHKNQRKLRSQEDNCTKKSQDNTSATVKVLVQTDKLFIQLQGLKESL